MAGRVVNTVWFQNRLKDLGKTQRGLADALGIDSPAVSNLLKGKRGISIDEAAVMTAYLQVDVDTLFTHAGIPMGTAHRPMIKVMGYVGAGDQVIPFDEDGGNPPLEEIEAPPGYTDGCAVIVRGDSYSPRYYDTEILAYRRGGDDFGLLVGGEVICKLMDGRMLLKRMVRSQIPGRYTLLSLNPTAEPIADVEIEWAAKIDWHKPR